MFHHSTVTFGFISIYQQSSDWRFVFLEFDHHCGVVYVLYELSIKSIDRFNNRDPKYTDSLTWFIAFRLKLVRTSYLQIQQPRPEIHESFNLLYCVLVKTCSNRFHSIDLNWFDRIHGFFNLVYCVWVRTGSHIISLIDSIDRFINRDPKYMDPIILFIVFWFEPVGTCSMQLV